MSAPARRRRRQLRATLEAVDQFCAELRGGELLNIPEQERFPVELLLREALANAVLHAPGQDAAAEVWCEIEHLDRGIVLRIGDNGGFDWRPYLHAVASTRAESGRGISILRSYSAALRFSDKGNVVEIVRVFRQGESHGKV